MSKLSKAEVEVKLGRLADITASQAIMSISDELATEQKELQISLVDDEVFIPRGGTLVICEEWKEFFTTCIRNF